MCQVKFNENIFTLNCFLEVYTIVFSLPVVCWTYNQNIVEYCTCDIITHYRAATAGKAPKVGPCLDIGFQYALRRNN